MNRTVDENPFDPEASLRVWYFSAFSMTKFNDPYFFFFYLPHCCTNMELNVQSLPTCRNGSCFKRDLSQGPFSRWQNPEKDNEMRVNMNRIM
jgi:hypothetical protein